MMIDPEKQFPVTAGSIRDILSYYSLNYQSHELATSGIENRTILVQCLEGRYVLRAYRALKKSDEHVIQEVEYMQFLRDHDFKLPAVHRNSSGETLTKYDFGGTNWQILLMDYMEGHHAKRYSGVLLRNLARTQAKIHLIGNHTDKFQGSVLWNLRERHFIKDIRPESQQEAKFLERGKDFHVELSRDLPFGLCHLDYDRHNILTDNDDQITAILDFDDLALAPYVLDLGYSAWDVFYDMGEKGLESYINEYEAIRPLSNLERKSIQSVLLFRHYVVSAIFIQHGKNSDSDIKKFITCEENLQKIEGFS